MRSSASPHVALVGLVVGLVVGLAPVYGCSPSGPSRGNPFTTGNGGASGSGTSGAGGDPGMSGSTGTSGAGGTGGMAGSAQGTAGMAGATAGTTGTGGAGGAGGVGGGGTAGSTAGAAGQSMAGSTGAGNDITRVVPTPGCGMDPGQAVGSAVRGTIQTSGTKDPKCADSNCAPWSYLREYFVTLPAGYDKSKAYPLVFEGPGCGSGGQSIYPLAYMGANSVNNTVIRVGLTPPPNTIGHATNPGKGCFDDKEGDDSVDWVFYEKLWDKLAGQLCFDKNRVFAAGDSSGGWFSNEVGCKYAGDAVHPIRGIMPNTGGLPSNPAWEPTCTSKPMAGMWVGETMDPENPFVNNEFGITRAMAVNHCAQTTFAKAVYANFPIGGNNADTVCKRIQNCPDLYPLVVCLIPGNQHASHANVTIPGFGTFLTMFEKAPLLTP